MERVLYALIKKQSFTTPELETALSWFLSTNPTAEILQTAITNYPVVFDESGNLLGSNLPLTVNSDETGLTYGAPPNTDPYEVTNLYGENVKVQYNFQESNTILGLMEAQDPGTKTAMNSLVDAMTPASDLNIVTVDNKDAASIFGAVSGITSDMKKDYLKGMLKLQNTLGSNLDLMTDNIKNMVNQIIEVRTVYNSLMTTRSNVLANAFNQFKTEAAADATLFNPSELQSKFPDIFNTFNENNLITTKPNPADGYNTLTIKKLTNPVRGLVDSAKEHLVIRNILVNYQSLGNGEGLRFTGTNFADFNAALEGDVPIVCMS